MSKTFKDGIAAAVKLLEMSAEDLEHCIPRMETQVARAGSNLSASVQWLTADLESIKSKAKLLRGQAEIIRKLRATL
jgi:hypothetical protein